MTHFPPSTAGDFILALENHGTTLKLLASPFRVFLFQEEVDFNWTTLSTDIIDKKVACFLMAHCHISLVDKLRTFHVNILGTTCN